MYDVLCTQLFIWKKKMDKKWTDLRMILRPSSGVLSGASKLAALLMNLRQKLMVPIKLHSLVIVEERG